jgi:hypothetical protein
MCNDYPGGQQSEMGEYGNVMWHDISSRITMSRYVQLLAWLHPARLFTASHISEAFLDRYQLSRYALHCSVVQCTSSLYF